MTRVPSEENKEDSDALMSVSDQYLRLATASAATILAKDNKSMAFYDLDGESETYDEQTYYCDQNIGVAVIFNLFHGIELFLKALLMRAGQPASGHAINDLIRKCQAAYPQSDIASFIARYFPVGGHVSSISRFFEDNKLQPDLWYEALKYPETKSKVKVSHIHIKFSYEKDKELWRAIAGAFPLFRKAAESAVQ